MRWSCDVPRLFQLQMKDEFGFMQCAMSTQRLEQCWRMRGGIVSCPLSCWPHQRRSGDACTTSSRREDRATDGRRSALSSPPIPIHFPPPRARASPSLRPTSRSACRDDKLSPVQTDPTTGASQWDLMAVALEWRLSVPAQSIASEMTYYVSSETLNSTHSLTHPPNAGARRNCCAWLLFIMMLISEVLVYNAYCYQITRIHLSVTCYPVCVFRDV